MTVFELAVLCMLLAISIALVMISGNISRIADSLDPDFG
jgi:hypothetical protein